MKRTRIEAVVLSGMTAMTLTCGSAMAQEATGDIVVTARRSEERLQDVPISITVFSQQALTDRNVVAAGDLATYTPSLAANSRFGSESTSFAIRGFTQEVNTSPSVGVYFADVISPRVQGATTAGNGAGPGAFFDLQNVQVLKGPQGTLFGRNTTGGAILLVPQRPTRDFGGYIEGSLGNYDMRRIQAVINLPVTEALRVRLGVDHQQRDGYLKNISGIGPRAFEDVDYTALRLSVIADLSDEIENYTVASYTRSDTNGGYPRMFVANPTGYRAAEYAAQIASTGNGFYTVSNGNPDPYHKSRQWQVINTTTWLASDSITIKNIASYGQFRQSDAANIYGDNGFVPGSNPPAFDYAIAILPRPGSDSIAQSTFTEELQLQGHVADDRFVYQAGGYFERSMPLGGFQAIQNALFLECTDIVAFRCADVRGRSIPNGRGGTLEGRVGASSISQAKYNFRNLGLYAQGTFKFTDQLSLTGGLRYTSDVTRGLGQNYKAFYPAANTPSFVCTNPVPLVQGGTSAQILADPSRCDFSRRTASSRPTWLVGLDYKPSQDILVYGKYSRGYRQGSVNVSSYGLETWGPEKVDTYEVGAKTTFRGAVAGTFDVAAFYNDFSRQQLQVGTVACTATDLILKPVQCPFAAAPTAGIANSGKSVIKGVEADVHLVPARGLSFDVGYAYLDSKLKSIALPPPPPGFTAIIAPRVGGELPLTPRNKYTIGASYRLPLDPGIGAITLGATFTHQDSTLGNTSSLLAYQTLPSQDNLNVNLNWTELAGTPIDMNVFVTNVTRERYYVYTVGNSFGFDSYIANQPRMFGVRVRYRFGQ